MNLEIQLGRLPCGENIQNCLAECNGKDQETRASLEVWSLDWTLKADSSPGRIFWNVGNGPRAPDNQRQGINGLP